MYVARETKGRDYSSSRKITPTMYVYMHLSLVRSDLLFLENSVDYYRIEVLV
jgi:hypothetical protein